MREKLVKKSIISTILGITPAYAGKTFFEHFFESVGRDHPRVCGKNVAVCGCFCLFVGSPPRMREKRGIVTIIYSTTRITPAYAGKTIVIFIKRV